MQPTRCDVQCGAAVVVAAIDISARPQQAPQQRQLAAVHAGAQQARLLHPLFSQPVCHWAVGQTGQGREWAVMGTAAVCRSLPSMAAVRHTTAGQRTCLPPCLSRRSMQSSWPLLQASHLVDGAGGVGRCGGCRLAIEQASREASRQRPCQPSDWEGQQARGGATLRQRPTPRHQPFAAASQRALTWQCPQMRPWRCSPPLPPAAAARSHGSP